MPRNFSLYVPDARMGIYDRSKVKWGNDLSSHVLDVLEMELDHRDNEIEFIVNGNENKRQLVYSTYEKYFGDISRNFISDNEYIALMDESKSSARDGIWNRFRSLQSEVPRLYWDVMQMFIEKHPNIARDARLSIPDDLKEAVVE